MNESLKNLKFDEFMMQEIKNVLKSLKEIENSQVQIDLFIKDYKISEKEFQFLINDNFPISEDFFELYTRLYENIKIREKIVKNNLIAL